VCRRCGSRMLSRRAWLGGSYGVNVAGVAHSLGGEPMLVRDRNWRCGWWGDEVGARVTAFAWDGNCGQGVAVDRNG